MQPNAPWWHEAVRLERADRLQEAEAAIEEGLRPQAAPWEYQCAYLYELRAVRLHAGGQVDAVRDAVDRANRMMQRYASGATSGSEGLLYSHQAAQVADRLDKLLRTPPPTPPGTAAP
jgi:hypothetical protein